MAVRIRLRRTGKRNAASHRIVVADCRSPRDGRFIENIGVYDPRHKFEHIDLERVDYWLPRGAQPSETVMAIIKRAKAGIPMRPVVAAEKPAAADQPAVETAAVPAAVPAAETTTGAEEAPTAETTTGAEEAPAAESPTEAAAPEATEAKE